jgi:DNA-binding Xre family transcriptional regulator
MGLSYRPLWKLLVDRDMKKTDLKKVAGISSPTLAKLSKNKPVDGQILERICAGLLCQPGQVVEYVP